MRRGHLLPGFFPAKSCTLASGISVLAEPAHRWTWEDPLDGVASITGRRAEIRGISDRVAVHRMADEFLDMTELGMQDEPFKNCKLFNRVTSLAVDGTTVRLEGEILNQLRRIGTGDAVRPALHVRAKGTGERAVVEVPDVRADESRISCQVSFGLGSVATVLSSRSLVSLNTQVLWEGREHTTALCVRGRDLAPLGRVLKLSGLWPDITNSGNLV